MIFQQNELVVRELKKEDSVLLAKWLSDPVVLEFYEGRDNPFDLNKVKHKFFDQNYDETRCIIEYDGKEIGYLQFYELDDEAISGYGLHASNERVYGMDQFIGEIDFWNRGVGTKLVSATIQYLVDQKQVDKIVMDPQVVNERAIACYEKCGFKKVKILPKSELHEGELRDCWLIEYTKQVS
ncbi:MAG: GNAT family N-acetyltransferase [Paenisporosarcina sp.]